MIGEWLLLVEPEGRPGVTNMALDQALLDDAARRGSAALRLYHWTPPCLSFGRNEPAAGRYDRARIEQLGIDVVRRPTGGRAVWHDQEVTYAVAAPVAVFGSLRSAYRAIHTRLAAALRTLGADVSLAPDRLTARPPDRPGSCFDAPVGGEVLVGDRKLVGSAQVRLGDAFLQHGSILLAGTQDVVRAVSCRPSVVGGSTTMSTVLGRAVTFEEVADAIVRTWGARLTRTAPSRPLPSPPAPFLDPAWTWRR